MTTPNLELPLIAAAQAQKHVTHNEALHILDAVVQLAVQEFSAETPPAAPEEGQVWALGASPTGDWAGQSGKLAARYGGAWQFVAPQAGWIAAQGTDVRVHDGTGWVAIGSAIDAIANLGLLGINTTADTTNRLSVSAPATLLNHQGAGHQLKLNKATAGDTASLLFQTGFSGRAEMGTAGSDDFAVKVSADGSTWFDALLADRGSGRARLPGGARLPDGSAGTPALAFHDDPDSGLCRVGADQIGLATGGTLRATLTTALFQINLPVTGTAVAQSQTDTTAGRLLTTGRFGLGCDGSATTTPYIADIDSASTATGFYAVQTSTPGTRPTGATNYAVLIVARQALTGFAQVWFNSNGTGQYFRTAVSGTWSAWAPFYSHNNILGTVSQSGGVPTGAVFQGNASTASPAGGHVERTAAGFQNIHLVVNSSTGGDTTVTFTNAFLSGSSPAVSITPEGDSDLRPRLVSVSPTAVVLSVRDSGGARVAVPAHVHVSGRWSNMT